MSYDFSGLTVRQQEVLTFQGWDVSMGGKVPQPAPKTVRKLIERGLVVERINKGPIFTVREYEVPINVHIAWCDHCLRASLPEVP